MPLTNERHDSNARVVFYALWITVSLLQASFTNLIPDEAYYWKYSTELAWGYYDHPPVIAVMIKLGYMLFQSELGVRLLSILAMAGTIRITEHLTRPRSPGLFYISIASLAVLHIAGILAVPDAPLLFFTACFFLLYKRYTENDNVQNVLLLSLCVALLLLSKYHGILVILFTLLSDLRLFKRRSFWLIVAGSIILFLPHVIWQAANGYPSIRYHLFGRNQYHYEIDFTLNYLLSAVLIFAPVTGIVIQYFALRKKASGIFAKALSYNLLGGLVFFFLMSFKGRVEGNWVLYLMIPAICLGYPVLESKKWHKRFIRISFYISIVLIFVARTVLINDLWNINSPSGTFSQLSKRMQDVEYIGWEAWAKKIKERAGETPVAFINSYQRAAEYEFYSGERSFALNNIMGRLDQYNIWNYENDHQGKQVFVITNFYVDSLRKIETNKGVYQYSVIDPFYSSSNIRIDAMPDEMNTHAGDSITLDLTFSINEGSQADAEANAGYPMFVTYEYFDRNGFYSHTVTDMQLNNELLDGHKGVALKIAAPGDKGDYSLFISVSAGWLPPSITGANVTLHNR